MTEVVEQSAAPLMVEVTGHGKVPVGPGQALYLTKALNSVLVLPQPDGTKSYVLLKKDGKTGYNSPSVQENVENGTFTLTAQHPLELQVEAQPLSDAMSDLIELSKVKSYHKVVNGHVVFVDSYTNKVIKKLVDLTDPNGDLYKIPGSHQANLKKAGMKDGLIRLPKGTKVYITSTDNVIVDPPGIKAFTFKTDGDIVPTMKVMLDKAAVGKLTAILPYKDQSITAKAETAAESALKGGAPFQKAGLNQPKKALPAVAPSAIKPGVYASTSLTGPLSGLKLQVHPDGSGTWLYSEIPDQGPDIDVPKEKVDSFFNYGYTFEPVAEDSAPAVLTAATAPVGAYGKGAMTTFTKVGPNSWKSPNTTKPEGHSDEAIQKWLNQNGITIVVPATLSPKDDGGDDAVLAPVGSKVTLKDGTDTYVKYGKDDWVSSETATSYYDATMQSAITDNGATLTKPGAEVQAQAADAPQVDPSKPWASVVGTWFSDTWFGKSSTVTVAPDGTVTIDKGDGDVTTFKSGEGGSSNWWEFLGEGKGGFVKQGTVSTVDVNLLPNFVELHKSDGSAGYYIKLPETWKWVNGEATAVTAAVVQEQLDNGDVYLPVQAKDMPLGSQVDLPGGTYKKVDENTWTSDTDSYANYADSAVQPHLNEGTAYVLPDGSQHQSKSAPMPASTPSYKVDDLPVGARVITSDGFTYEKQEGQNWKNITSGYHNANVLPFLVQQAVDSGAVVLPSGQYKAVDLPVGTKVAVPSLGAHLEKKGPNTWVKVKDSTGLTFGIAPVTDDYAQARIDQGSAVTLPGGLTAASAKVGSVLKSANDSGYYVKTDSDLWKHVDPDGKDDGSTYPDSDIQYSLDYYKNEWSLEEPPEGQVTAEPHPFLPHIGWPVTESVVYKYKDTNDGFKQYAVSYADGSWIVISDNPTVTPQVHESDSSDATYLSDKVQSGDLVKIGEVHDEPEVAEEKAKKKSTKKVSAADEDLAEGVSFANKYEANAYVKNTIFASLKKRLSGVSYYNTEGNAGWGNLTMRQRADILTEDGVRETLKDAIAALKPIAKWDASKIEKSEKMALGKQRARFETYLRASDFLLALKADSLTDSEIATEKSYLESRMGYEKVGIVFGSKWPLDTSSLFSGIESEVQVHLFNKKIAPLGWTPQTATEKQLTDYIKGEGKFAYADLLSATDKTTYVQLMTGDPETPYGNSIDSLKAKAAWNAVKASLVLKAQAVAKDAVKDEPQTPNATAIQAAEKASKNSLVSLYEAVDNVFSDGKGSFVPSATATWVAPGGLDGTDGQGNPFTYSVVDSTGEPLTSLSDDQMLDVLASGAYKPHPLAQPVYGPKSPYAGHDFKAALQSVQDSSGHGALSFWSPQVLNAYIKTHGGNYVGVMDADTKRKWVMWNAKGDLVATYAIENAQVAKTKAKNPVHTLAKSHSGSPDSKAGKVTIQTLVDWVYTRPWSVNISQNKPPTAWSEMDLKAALNDLDMQPFSGVPFENLSKSGLAARVTEWLNVHPFFGEDKKWEPSAGIKKATASPTDGLVLPPLTKPVVLKGSIDQADWDALTGLENDDEGVLSDLSQTYGDMPAEQVKTAIQNTSYYGSGLNPSALSKAPLNVQRFFLIHQTAPYDQKQQFATLFQALVYKVKQGAYVDPTKQTFGNWVTPNAGMIWLKPGDHLLQRGPNTTGMPDFTFLKVSADGSAKAYDDYAAEYAVSSSDIKEFYATGLHIVDGPKVATPTDKNAAAEAGFSSSEYEALKTYEGLDGDKVKLWEGDPTTLSGIDDVLSVKVSSSTVSAFTPDAIAEMPLSVKKYAVFASMNGDTDAWNLVAWKANNGGYAKQHKIDPDAPYAEPIKAGYTHPSYVSSYWSAAAQEKYIEDFDLYVPPFVLQKNVIAAHLGTLNLTPGSLDSPDTVTDTSSSALVFHEVPGHHGLGGMHSKSKIADQYGRYWMVKSFASDPNGPARVDSEHAANLIGRLFGFHQPETRVEQWKGKYSYIQILAPAKSDAGLVGVGPLDLTDEQLYQAMAEHVLDYMISNHDTHPANLLLDPNGKDVIGIDKGQAFKFFPNDKLQVGWVPPGNGEAVWFDQFYYGIQKGTIPKEKADAIVSRVLLRAKSMQTRKDAQYRDMLELAFKSRKTWPDQYPTKDKFIDALMERKHNLLPTFEDFYKNIYAKSPYKWDIDVNALQDVKSGEGQHAAYLGTSQELVDEAVKSKVFGKAAMFDSLDLEDGHLLLYTEKAHNGATIFNGSGTLLKEADAKVMKWLKGQKVENSGTVQPDVYNVIDPAATLPNNDQWYGMILNGVKTINTHAADQQFNVDKIAQLESAKEQITKALAGATTLESVKGAFAPGQQPSIAGVGKFEDKDQYDAWKSMAESYLDTIKKAEEAKASASKYKGFHQIVYSPKPKAKMEEEYTGQNAAYSLKHFADGTWKQVASATGETYDVSADQAQAFIKADKLQKSDVSAVSVGTKTLKVIKRNASGTQGKLDPMTGELMHTSADQSNGQTGYEYDVEFGNTRITYKPWTGANVAPSQQGQIRFHIKDFNGNLSEVDEALDVMRTMGVTMEPADDESLELLYWRMVSAVASDRKVDSKIQKVVDGYTKIVQARSAGSLSAAEELSQIKALWADAIGKDKVDKANWRPHFDKMDMWNPEDGAGHPYWLRPDLDLATVKKYYGKRVPWHKWMGGSGTMGEAIGSSGLIATDERLRLLGSWIQGMSSGPDQVKGSAGYVFTRQHNNSSSGHIYLDPVVALRLHNYAFPGDHYGDITARKNGAPWDPATWLASGFSSPDPGNELMVKWGVGPLDGIAVVSFSTPQERDTAVKRLAEKGITEIRGMPVTERFITGDATAALAKAWTAAIEWEKTHGDD